MNKEKKIENNRENLLAWDRINISKYDEAYQVTILNMQLLEIAINVD